LIINAERTYNNYGLLERVEISVAMFSLVLVK